MWNFRKKLVYIIIEYIVILIDDVNKEIDY